MDGKACLLMKNKGFGERLFKEKLTFKLYGSASVWD